MNAYQFLSGCAAFLLNKKSKHPGDRTLQLPAVLGVVALVLGLGGPGPAHASSIIYQVDRTIGAGTVTGFIETDGTIGTLAKANITDFLFTLDAPNLLPGGKTITNVATIYFQGSAVEATATEITFDYGVASSHLTFYDWMNGYYYWCVHTTECFSDSPGPAETMGPSTSYVHAQRETRSGVVVIATAAGGAVPLPGALPLFGAGLVLVGLAGRPDRRKRPG